MCDLRSCDDSLPVVSLTVEHHKYDERSGSVIDDYSIPQSRAQILSLYWCSDTLMIWNKSYSVHCRWHTSVVAGGKETQHDVWKYNGALDKWIQIEPLSTARWRHKMAVNAGKVYVLGGFDGVQRLASVEAYDPFHNRWTQVNKIKSWTL